MIKLRILVALAAAAVLSVGGYAQTRLSLDEMFALADSLNPGIIAANLAVQEAQAGADVARDAYLPDISVSASVSYNGLGYSFDRSFGDALDECVPAFGNNLAVEVSQVVFAGGAIRAGVEAAEIAAGMKSADAASRREDVRFLIVGNSLEIMKLENQVKVVDENIAVTVQMLENMRRRYEAGAALRNDITRYELQLRQLQHTRVRLLGTSEKLQCRLAAALGIEGSIMPLVDTEVPALGDGDGFWVSNAMEHSPAIHCAELNGDMSRNRERLVKAGLYPQIALFAADQLNGPDITTFTAGKLALGRPLDRNFNFFTVGVGIRYDIGSLYRGGRRLRQARAAVSRADAELADARIQVSTEIAAAYIDYRDSFSLLAIREKSAELAKENYELVSSRYGNDMALITELLDASAQMLGSELELVNSRIDVLLGRYRLEYISGTL